MPKLSEQTDRRSNVEMTTTFFKEAHMQQRLFDATPGTAGILRRSISGLYAINIPNELNHTVSEKEVKVLSSYPYLIESGAKAMQNIRIKDYFRIWERST